MERLCGIEEDRSEERDFNDLSVDEGVKGVETSLVRPNFE